MKVEKKYAVQVSDSDEKSGMMLQGTTAGKKKLV